METTKSFRTIRLRLQMCHHRILSQPLRNEYHSNVDNDFYDYVHKVSEVDRRMSIFYLNCNKIVWMTHKDNIHL